MQNMKNKIFLLGALALLSAIGCKSQYDLLLNSPDVDMKYEAAFDFFNNKKYKKAAGLFESLAIQTQGTEKDDTVRYYWALSNYKLQDYVTAEANFTSFLDMYSRSPFTQDSRFLKLDCMYRSTYRWELDQNPTRSAIYAITEYTQEYPDSPNIPICNVMVDELKDRLDRKEFENARLYYKMEDYIAAKTSFKNILKDNADNRYREEVLYYLAKSSYKYAQNSVQDKQKDRYMDFVDQYYNFIGEVPESKFRAELDQLYRRYQRSTGQVVATSSELRADKKADKSADRAIRKGERQINRQKEATEKNRKKQLQETK